MSIIAVFMNREFALVGVDTAAPTPSGDIADISKLVPLVHMNAVIAYRGCAMFLEMLFAACHAQGGTADTLIERLPQILAETSGAFVHQARQMGFSDPALLEVHDVVFVGWSDLTSCMVCHAYHQECLADGFADQKIESWFAAPWDSSRLQMPATRNLDDLIEVANAQVRLIRTEAPGATAGGRLITALIVKDRMSISNMANLGIGH